MFLIDEKKQIIDCIVYVLSAKYNTVISMQIKLLRQIVVLLFILNIT